MAESSVAPKERVNIVYKPATGDAQEEIELPLKLIMMGDYTLQADDTPLEDRKTINIDKDNFNDVMRNQNLSLALNVPNRLTEEEGEEMALQLKLETLKDFDPEQIVDQIPELATLLELRQALSSLKGPLGNVPAFRRLVQSILADDAAREKLLKELNIDEQGGE